MPRKFELKTECGRKVPVWLAQESFVAEDGDHVHTFKAENGRRIAFKCEVATSIFFTQMLVSGSLYVDGVYIAPLTSFKWGEEDGVTELWYTLHGEIERPVYELLTEVGV